jgi:hypothetical protein
VIKQCGADAFPYASDYPHEVDLVAAKQMIHDTVGTSGFDALRKSRGVGRECQTIF